MEAADETRQCGYYSHLNAWQQLRDIIKCYEATLSNIL
jgi:hypothetical protein